MADTEKFQGKYRISSARWANWDYSSNAVYFVTICTADRSCYFGSIKDGVIFHTPLGKSAVDCWYQIPKHFPFVELGEFVVMPNHVHGIIVINKNEDNDAAGETNIVETRIVETQNLASLPRKQRNTKNKFGPQSKNLASIIRGYKIGVTKFARENNIPFAWQSRYHDRVVRNDDEHERINQYILTNAQNWSEDELLVRG